MSWSLFTAVLASGVTLLAVLMTPFPNGFRVVRLFGMSRGLFDILSQYDLRRWKPDKGGPHEPLGTAFIFFTFKMTSYNSAQNGFTPVTRFGLSSI
ncbi:hypothetical protein BofuT4_uP045980.1 [Botrytis cinerea T4]|uniref:Uncharacterized protein n=1 Tax=Botryotinia fuckeliana (strain T4) TaxID=999810 RepID=G2XYP3_BOTF4|nr:hypothetical protein BofuT4_uP045980.1 [Botrytis cinerea T4]